MKVGMKAEPMARPAAIDSRTRPRARLRMKPIITTSVARATCPPVSAWVGCSEGGVSAMRRSIVGREGQAKPHPMKEPRPPAIKDYRQSSGQWAWRLQLLRLYVIHV